MSWGEASWGAKGRKGPTSWSSVLWLLGRLTKQSPTSPYIANRSHSNPRVCASMPRPEGNGNSPILRRSLSLHQGPESERWVGSALPLGMNQSSRTFHPGFKEDWKAPIYCEVKPSTNLFLFFLKHSLGGSHVSRFTGREIESFGLHLPGKDARTPCSPSPNAALPPSRIYLPYGVVRNCAKTPATQMLLRAAKRKCMCP